MSCLRDGPRRGTVGVLLMRSYVLAGNRGHYDGMIAALERRGLRVIPAFASGLDARPAIEPISWRTAARPSTRWSRSPASRSSAVPPTTTRRAPRKSSRSSMFPISPRIRSSSRHSSNGAPTARPHAGGEHHHGRDPRTRRRDRACVFGGRSDGTDTPCTGCERNCTFPTSAPATCIPATSAPKRCARASRR